MFFTRRHPPDDTLLLAADGALPDLQQRRTERHLHACPDCRRRTRDLQRILDETLAACEHTPPVASMRTDALRERLQGQLTELSTTLDRSWWDRVRRSLDGLPAALRVGAAIVLALFVAQVVARMASSRVLVPTSIATHVVESLPIGRLTPGAVAAIDASTLCAGRAVGRSPVAPAMREAVLRDYHMLDVPAQEYELDYLITPELGGIADQKNLWPQRYDAGVWNARVKDDLERLLPQMVCEGHIDLQTAQRAIADNWIDAYKTYFRTDRPLPRQAALRDDDDDQPNDAPALLVRAFDGGRPAILLGVSSRMPTRP